MTRIWNKHKINTPLKRKVFVAMSGGVDSSAAAALLQEEGYQVIGAHIKAWSLDEKCASRDMEDARRTADFLGIPFYVFDFEKEYREKVIDYFVETYKKGETPSPDVLCNSQIKFGTFLEKAKKLGADFIATGHYIKKSKTSDFKLLKGIDKNKDQSYFLWQLNQDQIKHSLFPVGDYLKPQLRELAKKFNLPTAEKKDSQGICFLGKINLKDFLKKFLNIRPGNIILPSGKIIGQHDGAVFYTIGQRHGLSLASSEAGIKTGEPLYIVDKDVKKNILVVFFGKENPLLYKREVWLKDINFISSRLPEKDLEVEAIIRYRQNPQKATLKFDEVKNKWKLEFFESVWAVALGQHAVFYQREELLGGGIIDEAR